MSENNDQTQGAGGTTIAGPPDRLDIGEMINDFGLAYSVELIRRNPELKLLAYRSQGWTKARIDKRTGKIIKGKWTNSEWEPTRIAAAIQNTNWYKTRDGNVRAADNTKAMDPASWNTRIERIASNLRDAATKAGATLDGINVEREAERLLRENFLSMEGSGAAEAVPQKIVDDFLAPLLKPVAGNTFKGEAEVSASGLRQKARQYGVSFSDQWFVDNVQKLRSGDISEADIDRQIVDAAKSRYTGLAGQISETASVQTLADPYIQMMAETLERNPRELSLADPDIQKALQFVDPTSGQTRMKTLWEFEQELRQKPEWGNTTRGRQALNDGAMSMLKSFGFVK